MGDIWDETFTWEAPAPAATTTGQETQQQAASAATAEAGLKSNTGMPSWWTDWAKTAWGNHGDNFFQGGQKTNDAYTKYFSGSPQYSNQINTGVNQMQDTFSKYFGGDPRYQKQTDQMVGALPSTWDAYKQMPGQIEDKRKAMIDQIYASMPRMQELYQPTMEGMSRKGILNSDVTGKALADIQSNTNRDITGQTAAANTWAADQNINHTTNMSTVLNGIINGMLGASGSYTNQGTSALTGAGNVSGNNINASNLYSNFGKDAASVGTAQQSNLNELIKLLQQSQTFNV